MPIPDKFPEMRLVPRPLTSRGKLAAAFGFGPAVIHSYHKIGGEPDWIQDDETPECCGQKCIFYGQLDSLGGKYDLVDSGMIFVFLCHKCLKTHSVFQFD